ncbi:hypothetical protein SO694_00191032 [Aureococcus anophagefferens]|uniref:Uncharacterized protein n=1 Tax=Aureococcus anophagefferens TaxID=44056 RepID=A0ABR1FP28_AURAN
MDDVDDDDDDDASAPEPARWRRGGGDDDGDDDDDDEFRGDRADDGEPAPAAAPAPAADAAARARAPPPTLACRRQASLLLLAACGEEPAPGVVNTAGALAGLEFASRARRRRRGGGGSAAAAATSSWPRSSSSSPTRAPGPSEATRARRLICGPGASGLRVRLARLEAAKVLDRDDFALTRARRRVDALASIAVAGDGAPGLLPLADLAIALRAPERPGSPASEGEESAAVDAARRRAARATRRDDGGGGAKPTMGDVRNKIAKDLDMADAAEMLELVVCDRIGFGQLGGVRRRRRSVEASCLREAVEGLGGFGDHDALAPGAEDVGDALARRLGLEAPEPAAAKAAPAPEEDPELGGPRWATTRAVGARVAAGEPRDGALDAATATRARTYAKSGLTYVALLDKLHALVDVAVPARTSDGGGRVDLHAGDHARVAAAAADLATFYDDDLRDADSPADVLDKLDLGAAGLDLPDDVRTTIFG